ncbi:hypothetical protein GCM10020218_098980 [Dactylosporangium vinaceum]|uniref:Beta-ketoacyl-[acyl-carrier-protein] synthase III N-terminal domain-containing protein n=1 Tax=Dactylosporangium vinaceum TaxID=53362 RepID=A0ABV5MSA2_9ACTN|nr:hypothetical protein [Dactylosporangium vinaceum]
MSAIARLCAPAYELGEYADKVADLPEVAATEPGAGLLAPAAGFETYHWTDCGVADLLVPAARRALLAAELDPAEVDLVVLATDSLPRDRTAPALVAELLGELGLSRATALTIGLLDCATAMVALGTAASYVRDGTARQVLVLSGDVAEQATGGRRVVAGGAAIASDAAAGVVISADRPGRAILGLASHTATALVVGEPPPQVQLAARVHGHRALFDRLLAGRGLRPAAVGTVLPSNFARNVQRIYLSEAGFTDAQLALDNVARIGHCLGSDPLINLVDQPPGDRPAVLLGSGVAHLAAVLIAAETR